MDAAAADRHVSPYGATTHQPVRGATSEVVRRQLAKNRVDEAGLLDRAELVAPRDGQRRRIGAFDVELIPITDSVPHWFFATVIRTPQGVVMYSGDPTLDLTPFDGRRTGPAQPSPDGRDRLW